MCRQCRDNFQSELHATVFILRIGKGLYSYFCQVITHRRGDCLLHAEEIANVSFFLSEDQIDRLHNRGTGPFAWRSSCVK